MNQKGFTYLLLIVGLVILTGAIGSVYYFYKAQTLGVPSTNKTKEVLVTPTVSTPKEDIDPILAKCNKDLDLWSFLPENLKKETYKKGVVPPGEATYDLSPLAWTKDCNKLAFLLELVGRGGGAYQEEDFKPRGVYIFDNKNQSIKVARLIAKNVSIDPKVTDSNYWSGSDEYIFVEITNPLKSEFSGKRYKYDDKTGQVTLDKQFYEE